MSADTIWSVIPSSFFWFAFAVIIACIEIEAEGRHGWAERMPTWYRMHGLVARIYGMMLGGKPLTGYHSFMFVMPILLFHVPFFSGVEWTPRRELDAWALYFLWCPLWDYLWFVLNPHYGVARFRRENVWWHAKSRWILNRFPIDYAVGVGISFLFALAADTVEVHMVRTFDFAVLTVLTIVWAPAYHEWYRHMRRQDERHRARIFHRD